MQIIQNRLDMHLKAIEILQGIDRCNYFIKDAKSYLNNNQSAPWFHIPARNYTNQYNKYKAIRERLYMSYANVVSKLVDKPVESNARLLGTIIINENGAYTA